VAWVPLGWEAAWFSEIEPFPCALLAHRYPNVPNLGDMTRIHENETFKKEEIDVLVGGTPCQSFSAAGKPAWTPRPPWSAGAGICANCSAEASPMGRLGECYPESCRREADGTLVPFLGRWRNAGIVSRTECWTLGTTEFPSDVEGSSLWDISMVLERDVPTKYFLTPKAARGMLRRAARTGPLKPRLSAALRILSGKTPAMKRRIASSRRGQGADKIPTRKRS
jgi:C-5 cytosine-specific DNA methylase